MKRLKLKPPTRNFKSFLSIINCNLLQIHQKMTKDNLEKQLINILKLRELITIISVKENHQSLNHFHLSLKIFSLILILLKLIEIPSDSDVDEEEYLDK